MEISHKSNFIGICSKSKIIVQFVHYKSCKIWRKPRYAEKTTNLSQVTDKLINHVLFYFALVLNTLGAVVIVW